ncbi:MAG: hypothetical protein KIT31_11710 [Deltaproteobacteria bacterium]|nr:hypothetical protein [Deltaproteobacteria bacterium]
MRAILVVLLLGASACGGKAKGAGDGRHTSRPGVMPMLSELPLEAERRNSILDSSNNVAGPEHRKGFTKKERKAETAAATAAAILGSMFSKSGNVTIGTASTFDENDLVAPHATKRRPKSSSGESSGDGKDGKDGEQPAEEPSSGPLVPWIKLK